MYKITARIKTFNKDRLPEIIPHKYKTMSANMFGFYRGTCHIFYEDLHREKLKVKSPHTWICGDLHLENFGSYKGNNRLLYFDLNDFDESILAPASWELTRMVTSILVAFESLKIEKKKAHNMARLFLKTYKETLAAGKALYIEPQTARGIVFNFLNEASRRKKKELLKKKTEKRKGGRSIHTDNPKHLLIEKTLKLELMRHVTSWLKYNSDSPYNFKVKDVMFRLAGTSSLGLKRYVFLLENSKDPSKHILVEMKQSTASCLQQYLTIKQPSWDNDAERIVTVQKRMQNVSPALSSFTIFKGESFIIQEMQPTKDSIDFKKLKNNYRDMYQVIDDMAMLTASAQLRSAGRQGSANADELISFGESNKWQDAILKYAFAYIRQVKQDYKNFKSDLKKGF
ncbi:MAG: DUF2252 family protein [Ferruginibacter sp.]